MEIRTVSKYKQKGCTIHHLKLSSGRHDVIGGARTAEILQKPPEKMGMCYDPNQNPQWCVNSPFSVMASLIVFWNYNMIFKLSLDLKTCWPLSGWSMQRISECSCCLIVVITITGNPHLLGIKLEASGPASPVGDSGSCDGLNHRADHCCPGGSLFGWATKTNLGYFSSKADTGKVGPWLISNQITNNEAASPLLPTASCLPVFSCWLSEGL